MPAFKAVWHWAKIEVPSEPLAAARMRQALASRFPLDRFAAARARLDPHNILGSDALDALLGVPGVHDKHEQA